jgi:hypothetical protein
MNNDILSYAQKSPLEIELYDLLNNEHITQEEFKLLLNSNCNVHISDLIHIISKISNTTEIKKKILENRFDMIKIDDSKNLRLSPSKIKKLLYLNEHLKFTKDQKKGIKSLCEFLLDPDKKIYGFFGFAGTGKTTTLTTLVSQFLKLKMYKKIALVAPTNKAVSVIKNKFLPFLFGLISETNISTSLSFDLIIEELKSKQIHVDFITIHKLLNIKTDFDTNGKLVFVSNDKPEISKYDLIIIDECSMISIPMIDQLLFEIRKNNVKIIFSGDPAQLPPINERVSSLFINHKDDLTFHKYRDTLNRDKDKNKEIYTQNFLNSFLKERHDLFINDLLNMKKYTLTDVVRSKKENVTKTCLSIRHWIENRFEFPPLEKYKGLDGVNFFDYDPTKSSLDTEWFKKCLKEFKKGETNTIILTWTNNKAIEYNTAIRQMIFKKSNLNRFEVGDILILNDFYQIKTDKKPIVIYTSEHIHINGINIVNKNINLFDNLDTEINFKKFKNDQLMRKKYDEFVLSIKNFYKLTYKCYELKVNKLGEENQINLYIIHDDDQMAYERTMPLIQNHIKKYLISISPDLNREKLVNETIGKLLWKNFHDICIEPFGNVSYGYAITSHKAQGSNYYNVYIDAGDIMKNNKESEMRRCLYTAFTRTENELNILF